MTYAASEQSVHSGKPVELFRYAGTYTVFRYTSNPVAVEFQAPDEAEPFTYEPIAMKRSQVNSTTSDDSDNAEITIDMPVSTEIVAVYGFQIAPPELILTIFRGHNTGEFIKYWSGHVENINVVRGTATIRVPSRLAAALNTEFPNVYFQTPCNHDLYDNRCGIIYGDWSFLTAITAIDATLISLDDIGTLDGQLIGGEAVLASGERRMIVSQTATDISINYPFAGANVDDAITIAAGCDLAYQGDCKTRFDNTKRYGGFPYIPPKNIFSSGLEPGKNVADTSCLPVSPPAFDGWYWRFWVEWEVGGLADNAKPGLFFFNVEGVSFNYSESIDAYHQFYESNDPGGPYTGIDPVGMTLHIVNQTSFGLSGRCTINYQHWTWAEQRLLVSDDCEPGSDYIYPDGSIDIIGVFPRHWTVIIA